MQRQITEFLGPIFAKEIIEIARRWRYYLCRTLYGAILVFVMYVTWEESQAIAAVMGTRNLLARIAGEIFTVASYLQYWSVYLLVPAFLCGVIAGEREEHTLDLLFITPLTDREIVLGKLFSRVAAMVCLILCGVPVVSLLMMFGGISPESIWRVLAATLLAILFTGSHAIYFSVITKTPMEALARTYVAFFLWLAGLAILAWGFREFLQTMEQRVSPELAESLTQVYALLSPIYLCYPLVSFWGAVNESYYTTLGFTWGGWAWPGSFVLPLLWSVFLLWRAVGRLRQLPRTRLPWQQSLPRWLKWHGRETVPQHGLETVPQQGVPQRGRETVAHGAAVETVLPIAEIAIEPDVTSGLRVGARPESSKGVEEIQVGRARPSKTQGGPADLALDVALDRRRARAGSIWFGHVAVINPLWLRSRLTRVYDRAGSIGRLVWLGWFIVLFGILMMAIFSPGDLARVGTAVMFEAPTWAILGLVTALVAGHSLIGDRRRGFLEQVIVTPLSGREIIDGTFLAMWEHLRCLIWLPLALAVFFSITGSAPVGGTLLSMVTAVLFLNLLIWQGIACSLAARTTPGAVVGAFALPITVVFVVPMAAMSFRQDHGPALWTMVPIFFAVTTCWVWRKLNAASVSCFLTAVHLVLVTASSWWTYHVGRPEGQFPMAAMHPFFLIVAPLIDQNQGGYQDAWFHHRVAIKLCYWTALVANIVLIRFWLVWQFDRLVERVGSKTTLVAARPE